MGTNPDLPEPSTTGGRYDTIGQLALRARLLWVSNGCTVLGPSRSRRRPVAVGARSLRLAAQTSGFGQGSPESNPVKGSAINSRVERCQICAPIGVRNLRALA